MITVREASQRASKHPETVRRWIRSGRLTALKVGRRLLIDERDLDDLLEANQVVGIPSSWKTTWTGEPMPNWVSVVRKER